MSDPKYIVTVDDDPEDRWKVRQRLTASHNGEVVMYGIDHGEPEDNSFLRDYDWIKPALEQAYALGVADGAPVDHETEKASLLAILELKEGELVGLRATIDRQREAINAASNTILTTGTIAQADAWRELLATLTPKKDMSHE